MMVLAVITPESQLAIIVGAFAAIQAVIGGVMLVVQWLMGRKDKHEAAKDRQDAAEREERIASLAREDQRMARGAMNLAAVKASEVADAAREVKETLATATASTDKKLDDIQATGDEVRRNTNSALGTQYEMVATLREEKAARTKDPADIANAASARKIYDDHMASQKPVGPIDVKIVAPEPVKVQVVDVPVVGSQTVDGPAGKQP